MRDGPALRGGLENRQSADQLRRVSPPDFKEVHPMTDALTDLRAWQREQATHQERALRSARRAQQSIADLDAKRVAAIDALADAVAALEACGIDRDHSAALLGITPVDLSRITRTRRNGATATSAAAMAAERPKG
jgi:hypothetical protein